MENLAAKLEHLYSHPLVRIAAAIGATALLIGLDVAWRWRRLRAWIS
jgi:hypothetical protein